MQVEPAAVLATPRVAPVRRSWLDQVERLGNALPDPVAIFVVMIIVLVAVSAVGAALGWTAVNPVTGETLQAKSLLAEDMVTRLLTELPRTFVAFPPLGSVLTLVIAAGVADHSGLLTAVLRASLARAPGRILTPIVFLVGSMTTFAIDMGFVVYVPLAGVLYAAIGRHPVLGIVTAFAGCSVGLAGTLVPGAVDVLLLSITQVGAHLVDPSWRMNAAGTWYFGAALCLSFTAVGWVVLERVVAPRLGAWRRSDSEGGDASLQLSPDERRGLRAAGAALLAVAAGAACLTLWPGYTPLRDEAAAADDRLVPFFGALVALIFVLLVACGWAFGVASGSVRSHRDVIAMMTKGLQPMLPYLVLMFFAAQFVAMFGWSNLGPITAIIGAQSLRELDAPTAVLLPLLSTLSSWLDFLIASASAKWTVMSPVATPMFMLLGVSPEMTTAAYRVGDVVTNLISPLNAYLVLSLLYCQRWVASMRLGSFIALTLPLAVAFYVTGLVVVVTWVGLGLPVGPGASAAYALPAQVPN
jgi:aminobenzoyl-glutamate transport protein